MFNFGDWIKVLGQGGLLPIAPATKCTAVVPHDTNVVTYRGLYVGGAGNIKITPIDSATPVTFSNVPAGTILPVGASVVWAIGTTATLMIGLE